METMKKLINIRVFLSAFMMFSCSLSSSITIPLYSILDETDTDLDPDQHTRGFINCIESIDKKNGTSIALTPANSSFVPTWLFSARNLRLVNNGTRKPSIIVTPFTETQVRYALLCTKKQGYEIRMRSGGHDFEGLSYTADVPYVMIDFYNLRNIEIDVANQTAWVQTGAVLGELYYAISEKTDTLSFPGGVCPTVGIGAFIGGGGYGNLLRKYGLGADNVIDVRFLNVDGTILTRKSMGEDLFWAIRGGGPSSFGIVLSWKLRLVPVPAKVTVFTVFKTLSENATEILHKYQYVAQKIDPNLLLRVKIDSVSIANTTTTTRPTKTTRVSFGGIYLGRSDTLVSLMDENLPELGVTQEICDEVRYVQSDLPDLGYDITTDASILANRSAFPSVSYKGKSDYIRTPIPLDGVHKILHKFLETDGWAFVGIYPYGGKMDDISETKIPYPHRKGVSYHILEYADLTSSESTTTTRSRLKWLKELYDMFEQYVSNNPREQYFNYRDLDLGVGNRTFEEASEWGDKYWKRNNFERLVRIKAIVDPLNFFRHPQSIPVFHDVTSLLEKTDFRKKKAYSD